MFVVGLDSPIIVNKDVSTHTRAVKLKRQSLQDRLELCILELKKLCIREAVSNKLHTHVHTTDILLYVTKVQRNFKVQKTVNVKYIVS